MAKQLFVVQIIGTNMYLTGYNSGNPPESIFGNVNNAVTFATLDLAQETAAAIGAGTVGTTKP